MTVLTQPATMGDVLKYEVNPNYTREIVPLLVGTAYPAGSVLGRVTLSGKYTLSPDTGSNGAEAALGVLLYAVDTTGDDEIAVIFGKALAERAILDWEGVGDADGAPVPVTLEGIAALLDIWPIFERFQMGYVAKGLELDAEKNVSAPSPIGSTAGAKDIARPVRKAAKPARKS